MKSKSPLYKKCYIRSEKLGLFHIYIKADTAFNTISTLGELGTVQINDLNDENTFLQRHFVQEIRQCQSVWRWITAMDFDIRQSGTIYPELDVSEYPVIDNERDAKFIHTEIEKYSSRALDVSKNYQTIRSKYLQLMEDQGVLQKADGFFSETPTLLWSNSLTKMLLLDTNDFRAVELMRDDELKLRYLTGTIPIEHFFAFERMLWRTCRGNYFMRHAYLDQDQNENNPDMKQKFVFMIFFQGEELNQKIRKICQGFQIYLFQCPETDRERRLLLIKLDGQINDMKIILEKTMEERNRILQTSVYNLARWKVAMKKITATYHAMNKMRYMYEEKYYVAECWAPIRKLANIRKVLMAAAIKNGTHYPVIWEISYKKLVPPTYNSKNRLIYGFQQLINAYGVGTYLEMNPAPFTIVTFPFLFGVMFGDIGHGVLLAVFGSWMVYNEKRLKQKRATTEIWVMLFGGRYIILLMGLFSMYTGFIYNDIFSKSLNIFGSAWFANYNLTKILENNELQLNPTESYLGTPYPLGVDPIWQISGYSAIVTMNSFKMKTSIILGVIHMYFGLFLSGCNHIYFKNYVDLFTVCIPQMVFFSLFFYLVILIFIKWAWYSASNPVPYNSSCAPSILILFIDMMLLHESKPVEVGCQAYMFESQPIVQKVLIICALISIPIMLLAKPLIIHYKRHTDKHRRKTTISERPTFDLDSDDNFHVKITSFELELHDSSSLMSAVQNAEHEEPMSEVYIHQCIHTIETVLGSVSHTASYLRLWALSLAHAQLSHVMWMMVLKRGFLFTNFVGGFVLVFSFSMWAALTIAILVVMEGLSAFLHTLRLHWVEFQSKFYTGSGELFKPFDFIPLIEMEDDTFY